MLPVRHRLTMPSRPQRFADMPLLSSAFRPFYLLGALYAPLLAAGAAGAFVGLVDLHGSGGPLLWHGHEMLFGFATAIVLGTLLTALPSWAGMPELRGTPVAVLAAAWLVGRIAFWAAPWLPAPLVALADLLLWPLLLALLARPLWRVPQRLYRLLLPVLLALALANLTYHAAQRAGDVAGAERALRAAVWTLVLLYSLVGGLLTPIFTGSALRQLGCGDELRLHMPLEALALALLLALAAADLAAAPPRLAGALAAACALVHGLRVARWRGWRVADQPLLLSMHLGFAWLLLAFVLKALADIGGWVPAAAWLHAFTVGALGLLMLGLMTRVALRHTGRPLVVPRLLYAAGASLFVAAAARLAATLHGADARLVALAALLWAAAFAAYALQFAAALIAPSRPRAR